MAWGRSLGVWSILLSPFGAAAVACAGAAAGASSARDSGLESGPSGDGGGESADAELDARGSDAGDDAGGACYVDASGSEALDEYESNVAGTIRGPGIDGTLCQGGTGAYVQRIVPQGTEQQEYTLFFVHTVVAPDGSHPQVVQFTPPDVTGAWLWIRIGLVPVLGPPVPGSYTSADSACGDVYLYLDGGNENYYALGAHDCALLEAQTTLGSWTLQLTSVIGWDDGGPGSYYVVHGLLVAELVGPNPGDSGTVTLSFTF